MVKKAVSKKVKKDIDEFVDVLKKDKLPIKQVVLFGSHAKGNQNKWSDIDVCVVSPSFSNALEAMQYLWLKRTSDKTPVIEPVGFSPKDFADDLNPLIHEIKTTGVEIKI